MKPHVYIPDSLTTKILLSKYCVCYSDMSIPKEDIEKFYTSIRPRISDVHVYLDTDCCRGTKVTSIDVSIIRIKDDKEISYLYEVPVKPETPGNKLTQQRRYDDVKYILPYASEISLHFNIPRDSICYKVKEGNGTVPILETCSTAEIFEGLNPNVSIGMTGIVAVHAKYQLIEPAQDTPK